MSKEKKVEGRREFLKKSAYAAPAIITLKAAPAFAGLGSGKYRNGDSKSESSWSESSWSESSGSESSGSESSGSD